MSNHGVAAAAPDLAVLCIEDKSRGSGQMYHRYSREPVEFFSLFHAVMILDGLCDSIGYPIRQTNMRSFQKTDLTPRVNYREVKQLMSFEELKDKTGQEATFMVHVQFRQNATWQGQVTWVDKKETQNFRSVLELVKLMDSALNGEDEAETE